MKTIEIHECFSLRDDECLELLHAEEVSKRRCVGVMLHDVTPLPTPSLSNRNDGEPVEAVAVLACSRRRSDGLTVWVTLAPQTKELIGDLLFNRGVERGRWYWVVVRRTEGTTHT